MDLRPSSYLMAVLGLMVAESAYSDHSCSFTAKLGFVAPVGLTSMVMRCRSTLDHILVHKMPDLAWQAYMT
jgi:hypothetical protein